MNEISQSLVERFEISEAGVRDLNLFQRYEILDALGFLPSEENIGHPERSLNQWSEDEVSLVLDVFRTWPEFAEDQRDYENLAEEFSSQFLQNTNNINMKDRKAYLEFLANTLDMACKNVFGNEFPDVRIRFKPQEKKNLSNGRQSMFIGGLAPDSIIDICDDMGGYNSTIPRNFGEDISYGGDAAFIEFLCHEVIHLCQRFKSENSDGSTEDEKLSARVAEAFYESVHGAKNLSRQLYLDHPFEAQARKYAHEITTLLVKKAPHKKLDLEA